MIDRCEHANHEQADANLQRCLRKSGTNRGQADADEKYTHHAILAPLVGQPASRQRKGAKREETRCRIGQQFSIADIPFAVEHQRRHGCEDQHEEMVKKMSDVQ